VNKNLSTMIFDIGILVALVLPLLGIWHYPWVTLAALALLILGGSLLSN
jgi:hypothetical protein